MDSRMFDGMFTSILVVGIIIGGALWGVVAIVWWLCLHVRISWI